MARVPPEERCTCSRETDSHPASGSSPVTSQSAPSGTEVRVLKTVQDVKDELAKAGNKLVVIDFYSSTCVPCKQMAPKFEAWAKKYGDRAWFFKVCGEESPEVLEEYGVYAYPTFGFFKFGEIKDSISGVNEKEITETLERLL